MAPEPALGFGVFCCGAARGSSGGAGGLVVPGGVEGQFAALFAGGALMMRMCRSWREGKVPRPVVDQGPAGVQRMGFDAV